MVTKEEAIKYAKKYRQENKAKILAYKKKYRKKCPEKYRAENKRWKKKNREKVNAQKRAARRKTILIKSACKICKNQENLCLHHPDYQKPLQVITLCRTCHNLLHNNPNLLLNKILKVGVNGFN